VAGEEGRRKIAKTSSRRASIFFYFGIFLKKLRNKPVRNLFESRQHFFILPFKKMRKNPSKIYFQCLALSSHTSQFGETYEEVTPVHIT
jgi:hypothetical protein